VGAIFGLIKAIFNAPDPHDGSHSDVNAAHSGAQNAILKHIDNGNLDVPILG